MYLRVFIHTRGSSRFNTAREKAPPQPTPQASPVQISRPRPQSLHRPAVRGGHVPSSSSQMYVPAAWLHGAPRCSHLLDGLCFSRVPGAGPCPAASDALDTELPTAPWGFRARVSLLRSLPRLTAEPPRPPTAGEGLAVHDQADEGSEFAQLPSQGPGLSSTLGSSLLPPGWAQLFPLLQTALPIPSHEAPRGLSGPHLCVATSRKPSLTTSNQG